MTEYTCTITGPIVLNLEQGTLRIKNTTLLWKPRGERRFHRVTFAEFSAWMSDKPRVTK